jgi:hypothetical protein
MEIIKALKSSEIADNMTDAFVSNEDVQRYPFYSKMEQITPNSQNYPLISTPTQTVTTKTVIKDKIPKNYYLRGVFVEVSATVNKTQTGTGRATSYTPFDLSSFGLFKLFRYFRITQMNQEVKRINFNNILDIITNKYDAFTADSIFTIGSDSDEFKDKADGNYTISGLLYIPFSFSQMAKLCPDTTFLHPLELEIATGNDYDSSSIYSAIYYESTGNFDTITVSSMNVTCKYQFSSVDDVFYDQLKKDLYFGSKPKMILDFGYVSYDAVLNGAASPQSVDIPLNLGKLVKRYYVRALIKNNATNAVVSNSEFVDGSDIITNLKLSSGNRDLFNYNKKEAQLVSIVLGNNYRQSSANSIFGGFVMDMTNGFLNEKNNDYSSGFPEYYIEDPHLTITANPAAGFTLYILVTAEYYEVSEINPKNGIYRLVSDK